MKVTAIIIAAAAVVAEFVAIVATAAIEFAITEFVATAAEFVVAIVTALFLPPLDRRRRS